MPFPRLVQAFASIGCFTLPEAIEVTGKTRKSVLKDIEYLRSQGYLETVRRGLYALNPLESFGADPDPHVIASKVKTPYVLSHHSALELHGVAESAIFRRVTVATPKTFESFKWRDFEFKSVAIDPEILAQGYSTVKRSASTIMVASPELTVIQCADRPGLAGGFFEVVASVSGFPYLDWGPLLRLLELFDKTVLYRKVGYLVAVNADRWRPPEMVLRRLRQRLGSSTTYFGVRANQGGRHEPRWNVIVPLDAPEVSANG